MFQFRTRAVGVVSFVVALCGASLAIAQDEKPQEIPPIFAINSAGLDAWLTSEKDHGLRDLLHMVQPRLGELPAELERLGLDDAGDIPPGALESLWQIATQPQAMELRLNLARLQNQEAPVDLRWAVVAKDLASASNTMGLLRGMLEHSPLDIRPGSDAGVFIAQTPAMPVYFGARRAGNAPVLFLSTEETALPSLDARFVELPAGAEPLLGLRFDLAQLTPVIGMGVGMAPPVVGELLMEAGLIGWDATRFDLAIGHTDAHTVSVARMTGASRAVRLFVCDPARRLSADDLRLIPADATTASAGLYDPTVTFRLVRRILESLGMWEEFESTLRDEAEIDMSTIQGFIESLGDSWVYYQSDSTGGGEFGSAVLSVTLRSPAAFEQALVTAIGKANAIGQREGKGYFRIRSTEARGVTMYAINAPGLPVPAEPVIALSGDRVFFTLSMPSMLAAIDQQQRATSSIMTRAGVKAMAGGSFDDLVGFNFVDTERYARRGYATMNHLMSALANGVRSPSNDREPYAESVAMPLYTDFMAGVSPTVTATRWDGDDLVMTSLADRSITVQLAAGFGRVNLGGMMGSQLFPLMMVSGASGFEEARTQAQAVSQQDRSASLVRSAALSAISYASEDGKGLPASIDTLIEHGYITPSELRSPYGSMMDGTPDIVIRTDLKGTQPDFATTTILAIDRSAMTFNGLSPVGFMDGHVEWLSYEEVEDLLRLKKNAGAKAAFGF
ncbi:MAG: hypothetical protein ACIAQF_05175 [Phycisphaerales bacterium JB065]